MKPLLFTAALILFAACLDLSLRVGDTSHRLTAEPKNVATGVEGPSPVAALTPARVVRSHVSPRHTAHLHRDTLDWDALAQCEAGGDWRANTGNGFYGGLQFLGSTWTSFDTNHYATTADQATRWQQIRVAERVLRRQGLTAWPACTRALGWR